MNKNELIKKIKESIVYAETSNPEDTEFQCYVDKNGKIIPEGYPIGFEIGDELYLFDDIFVWGS